MRIDDSDKVLDSIIKKKGGDEETKNDEDGDEDEGFW